MKILAIETSCDETSVAVVENGVKILGMTTYSQALEHAKTGGVVPEVASREHSVKIIPCIEHVMSMLGYTSSDIDLLAVTSGPGLIGSLLVGVETAKALAFAWNKPLMGVNHIYGHIASIWLERSEKDVSFPLVVLTASGGHNDLYLMESHSSLKKLGTTLDDAAGEAFDKVATLLNLPYPGGPQVSHLAEQGNSKAYHFPRARLQDPYSFSFSGIKTAVKYLIRDIIAVSGQLSQQERADIAASFQEAVCDMLAEKMMQAARDYEVKSLVLAGGVSANTLLRSKIEAASQKIGVPYFAPVSLQYCTDNAAMIGCAAYFQYCYNQSACNLLPSDLISFPKASDSLV